MSVQGLMSSTLLALFAFECCWSQWVSIACSLGTCDQEPTLLWQCSSSCLPKLSREKWKKLALGKSFAPTAVLGISRGGPGLLKTERICSSTVRSVQEELPDPKRFLRLHLYRQNGFKTSIWIVHVCQDFPLVCQGTSLCLFAHLSLSDMVGYGKIVTAACEVSASRWLCSIACVFH